MDLDGGIMSPEIELSAIREKNQQGMNLNMTAKEIKKQNSLRNMVSD
jgi:hypothetical protein